jgi:hypothetical protein
MMANLTDQTTASDVELDTRPYGIATASYSAISSDGHSEVGMATEEEARLKVTRSLAPFEVIAVVFKRQDIPSQDQPV